MRQQRSVISGVEPHEERRNILPKMQQAVTSEKLDTVIPGPVITIFTILLPPRGSFVLLKKNPHFHANVLRIFL